MVPLLPSYDQVHVTGACLIGCNELSSNLASMTVVVFLYSLGTLVIWNCVVPTTDTLMYAPVFARLVEFPVK